MATLMDLVGKRAPAFSLKGDDGEQHALKDHRGKAVVIYFYPKAMTPGCTTESRDFSASLKAFEKAGAVVLGISPDAPERLARFREKEGLTHVLLSDPDHVVAEKYGAWGEKKLYGRSFEGILRSTVLVGPQGKVLRAWPKVKVKGHAQAVLEALLEG
ncbi:MAG: thioredoxin-dependent thiol peroxidase [Deltaproteobacteria bacterium]|nr:thioredoxin-dependent thiol peroxidase [Deltaproteobacteria bacterium]